MRRKSKNHGAHLVLSILSLVLALLLMLSGCEAASGTDGKDGINGADGIDGVNGVDGKDGTDGNDGVDGENGIDGEDGADSSVWYQGTVSADEFTDGKPGDFYLNTADKILYVKNDSGVWEILMENFSALGPIGAQGQPGEQGAQGTYGQNGHSTYTYIRFASDSCGTDISDTYTAGLDYICVLVTDSADEPQASEFKTWLKISGEHSYGHSYVYIRYASDAAGTGYSETHTDGLDYIGILVSDNEIADLSVSDFEGKWIKFVANIITAEMEYGERYPISEVDIMTGSELVKYENGMLEAIGVGTVAAMTADGDMLMLTIKPAVVDVVLFTGANNMVGQDTDTYTVDIEYGQAYEYKYGEDGLTTGGYLTAVANPCGENTQVNPTKTAPEQSKGSSLVPAFCEQYVESTGRRVVAVHIARGDWNSLYWANGNMSYSIRTKYTACIEHLLKDGYFEIDKQFYVSLYGGRDAHANETTETVKENLQTFHNIMTDEFGVDFGAIMYSGKFRDANETESVDAVNLAKYQFATEKDDIIICSVSAALFTESSTSKALYIIEGMMNESFNKDGLILLGKEACTNIVNYLNTGVDPVTSLAGGAEPGSAQWSYWVSEN